MTEPSIHLSSIPLCHSSRRREEGGREPHLNNHFYDLLRRRERERETETGFRYGDGDHARNPEFGFLREVRSSSRRTDNLELTRPPGC